ncbi:MAG: hypothetical protein JW809_15420 [Pirellulales bacterium]|nr:hypothetical protein [Pirellulales bacterium]
MNARRLAWVLVALALLAGCGKELQSDYGRRRGPAGDKSVNGTGVLADMFKNAGHTVSGWHRLSPRLHQRADCIVWFPDDFAPPSADVRAWLEDWLTDQPGRTLIYIGRDFDAARWYWERIRPDVPLEQREAFDRRLSEARAEATSRRQAMPASEDCEWFTAEQAHPKRRVTTLGGDPEWTAGIDPAGLDIELEGRLLPGKYATVLLESEGDMLVSREPFYQGQLIVVANGSFLLNVPLVNREHRKLAGKLIDAVGPAPRRVVFLESAAGGPTIAEKDDFSWGPSALAIFRVWPTNWILVHLVVVGVLFCGWRFPIFGAPFEPESEGRSDFGRHVEAVARLLRHTGDAPYAEARLAHYRQVVKPDE